MIFRKQFLLFLLIGLLNTAFGYSLFAFLIFCHCHYALATLASTVAGIVFNFMTVGRVVFKSQDRGFFLKFAILYSLLYFLSIFLLKILKGLFYENLYMTNLVVVVLTALVSFFANKYWVFYRKRLPS